MGPQDAARRVDETFGDGEHERVAGAAADAVRARLADGDHTAAAFSAAHHLILTDEHGWSEEEHRPSVDAWRRATVEDLGHGRLEQAGWRLAYLRLLGAEVEERTQPAVAALGNTLRDLLRKADVDVRTAGMAVDLFLLTGEWVPTDRQSAELLAAVKTDVEDRLSRYNNEVMAADRVALWLLASRPGQS